MQLENFMLNLVRSQPRKRGEDRCQVAGRQIDNVNESHMGAIRLGQRDGSPNQFFVEAAPVAHEKDVLESIHDLAPTIDEYWRMAGKAKDANPSAARFSRFGASIAIVQIDLIFLFDSFYRR
jgi:hypothetical protein